jgi:hypothetical protein
MTAINRTALTDIPITAAVGSVCFGGTVGASIYMSENTCSVIRVTPDSVGVEAGTIVVLGFE